jgi:hypothetical protein
MYVSLSAFVMVNVSVLLRLMMSEGASVVRILLLTTGIYPLDAFIYRFVALWTKGFGEAGDKDKKGLVGLWGMANTQEDFKMELN